MLIENISTKSAFQVEKNTDVTRSSSRLHPFSFARVACFTSLTPNPQDKYAPTASRNVGAAQTCFVISQLFR